MYILRSVLIISRKAENSPVMRNVNFPLKESDASGNISYGIIVVLKNL